MSGGRVAATMVGRILSYLPGDGDESIVSLRTISIDRVPARLIVDCPFPPNRGVDFYFEFPNNFLPQSQPSTMAMGANTDPPPSPTTTSLLLHRRQRNRIELVL